MTSANIVPELKQVLGAMLFGARQPVALAEMRRVLREVAETHPQEGKGFAKVAEADIVAALEQLKTDLAERYIGLRLVEVAGGFRFQTDVECGPWLRHLLNIGKPTRLTRPTLETLAIVAYRQPVTRAEIEGVRGVTVDTIVRNLLELQLIRIVGRSPLPGRPLLLGTTQLFLEHFGLKDLKDLPGIEQLCRKEEEFTRRPQPPAAAGGEDADGNKPEDDKATEAAVGSMGDKETKAVKGPEVRGELKETPTSAATVEEDAEEDDDEDENDDEDNDDEDEDDAEDDDGEKERPASAKKDQKPGNPPAAKPAEQGKQDHESQGA